MKQDVRARLLALDRDFYTRHAESFAASRQTAWPGWRRLPLPARPDVLDVAAGNLRFYYFLAERFREFAYLGVDASEALLRASGQSESKYIVYDILSVYTTGSDYRELLPAREYNFVFCSGFIHHVPGRDWRERLLVDLWSLVAPGGQLAVSFWQFATACPGLIVRDLGEDDYLLSWGQEKKPARFAHHCTDSEVAAYSELLVARGARVSADYRADGRTGELNRYLCWRKQ